MADWCVYMCVCVVHWHCTAQLSMFNMKKRYRNKIIIIIIIIGYSGLLTSAIHATFSKFDHGRRSTVSRKQDMLGSVSHTVLN